MLVPFKIPNGESFQYTGYLAAETTSILNRHRGVILTFKRLRQYSNIAIQNNDISESVKTADVDTIYYGREMAFKVNAAVGDVLLNQ